MTLDHASTGALWERFMKDRDPLVRERLAMEYLPLVREQVKATADRVVRARVDELERYGMIGLLKAIDVFDPDRGAPFESFAPQRIRGAIADYRRTLALGRARAGRLHAGQAPENRVPAALLRDADGALHQMVQGGEAMGNGRSLEREVWRAIEALTVSQKLVIGLHYCEGVTLEEVGRVLDISRREVRALRDEALHSVRTQLSLRSWLDGDPPAQGQARSRMPFGAARTQEG